MYLQSSPRGCRLLLTLKRGGVQELGRLGEKGKWQVLQELMAKKADCYLTSSLRMEGAKTEKSLTHLI